MDKERRKKIQTTKLIITEIFMLIIIVITVIVLTFIVMGYHLNEEGKLEQSGLVQVDSFPTGASVIIDDEILPNETNTSKILPEGNHVVKLKKDGYTSWSKTVALHSGFLTKLSYPHLYKENPSTEIIKKFEQSPSLFLASKNRSLGLVKYPNGELETFTLESKTPKEIKLNLSEIFKNYSSEELGQSKIISWSDNGERILISVEKEDLTKFLIVDLEHPEHSLDLSAEFDVKISDIRLLNSQGDRLGLIENHNFHTISLPDKKLSDVLVENVLSFSNNDSKIILITKKPNENKKIILYDITSKSEIFLADSMAENIEAHLSEYAGRFTLVLISDNVVTVRRGNLPSENISKENPLSEPVGKYTLDFGTPKDFSFKGKNQLIVTSSNNNLAVFDLENYKLSTYSLDDNLTFWPDEYTIGVVSGGKLTLYDFDGTNANTFKNAENGFPAITTEDNSYLYYISKDNSENLTLSRDLIK